MLVRVLLAAILAGVVAGVFATGAQALRVTPLIQQAETYEAGEAAVHGDAAAGHSHDHGLADEGGSWAPADGFERHFYTMLSNIVVAVGFSLVVTAAVLVAGQGIGLVSGLVWGIGGFVIFVLAPNLGLPPELPGMPAGDLEARQTWWLATVVATAVGLGVIAWKRNPFWSAAGLIVIALPHLYGAPAPVAPETAVPANLAAEFVIATIVTAFAFWLFLGGLLGFLLERAMRVENTTARAEAAA